MQVNAKQESIRVKILKVVLRVLVLLAFVMGFASIFFVNRLAKNDATHLMTQLCDKEVYRLDGRLDMVKHSVVLIYEYITEVNESKTEELFSKEYEDSVCEFATTVASQTDGAMAVYYHYAPELTGNGTGGIFWARNEDGNFEAQPTTDVLAYSSNDIEHVGWFYIPKETKKALWMKPYYNKNLDVFMISYIIPIYSENDDFIGVVGMDIDFDTILAAVGDIRLYDTGKVALVDLSERLIYTNDMSSSRSEKLSNKLYNHITTINKDSEILEITENNGVANVICCGKLSNGMVLYVTAPENEIYRGRNQLIRVMIALTILILLVAIFDIRRETNKIAEPINRLAEVTGKYAEGDWSLDYECDTGDELEVLSKSIRVMAKNTQTYMSRLNNLARTDSLTGLKNKTSYMEWVDKIKTNNDGKYDKFGIVVFDVNLLKMANDNFGHEAGDALIIATSKHICETFAHSPVFRVGGDEFVTILTGRDYNNRDILCADFEHGMGYGVDGFPEVKLYVSYGLALYPEEAPIYEDLFNLADERMYEKKRQMKMRREDQENKL